MTSRKAFIEASLKPDATMVAAAKAKPKSKKKAKKVKKSEDE